MSSSAQFNISTTNSNHLSTFSSDRQHLSSFKQLDDSLRNVFSVDL